MLNRNASAIDAVAGEGVALRLERNLTDYAAAMRAHAAFPTNESLAADVRTRGNRIVTLGENLALQERESVDLALRTLRRNFLILLAVIAVVLVATGFLLARRVARPLKAMEMRIEAVADGQLARLAPDSRDREFISLTSASIMSLTNSADVSTRWCGPKNWRHSAPCCLASRMS